MGLQSKGLITGVLWYLIAYTYPQSGDGKIPQYKTSPPRPAKYAQLPPHPLPHLSVPAP